MSLYSTARQRAIFSAKTHLGRRAPDRFGMRRAVGMLDDYEVADVIEVDGKIPLNYFTYRPNFGDLLSPWLVEKMTGKEVAVADRSKPHYLVIGSIINQGTENSVVWGSGTYGTEGKSEVNADARYTAVRGPLTRAKLSASKGFGIRVPAVYGDPALLLPLYYMPKVKITHEYGVVVRWSERKWAEAKYGPGVKMIDLSRTDIDGVISDLLSCRKIISSSLHGLIVADAYGVPNAWLASDSPRGGEYKFHDYFASVQKLRQPQSFDPAAGPVTREVIERNFKFSGEAITFNYRPLLDACPFLRRRVVKKGTPRKGARRRESGAALRGLEGTPALLPSLGYFGGIQANYLALRANSLVSEIRIYLPSNHDGRLDLRGLELYRSGCRVEIDDTKTKTAQSSNALPTTTTRSPFAYGGIRTEREVGSWWSVRFDRPVDIDEVRIYNRLDGYGVRSRAITVEVIAGSGEVVTRTSPDSDRVIRETLKLIESLTGKPVKRDVLKSAAAAGALRTEIVRDLAQLAQSGLLTENANQQRLLASLLVTRRPKEARSFTDDEWKLLGHLLAAERLRIPRTATSMRAFQLMLSTRAELTRLTDEVNRAAVILGDTSAVLTRHGFAPQGVLRADSDSYMALIGRASAALAECGYPAMLAYGTLLGYVREGDFLAHDDDVDILIPVEVGDWSEVEGVLLSLHQQLRDKGWKVSRPNSYTNFHLTDAESDVHLDVFPVAIQGARSSLHMEKMAVREIDTDIILPPKEADFNGSEVLIPANATDFLVERYGPTWATADPFYDWPWKLSEA